MGKGISWWKVGWFWFKARSETKAKAAMEKLMQTPKAQAEIVRRGDLVAGNTIRHWMDSRGISHCSTCLSTDQLRTEHVFKGTQLIRGVPRNTFKRILYCPKHDPKTAQKVEPVSCGTVGEKR